MWNLSLVNAYSQYEVIAICLFLLLQLKVPSRDTTYWCSNHILYNVTKVWNEEIYVYKVSLNKLLPAVNIKLID